MRKTIDILRRRYPNLDESLLSECQAELDANNMGISELFRRVTEGLGKPTTHCSGKNDDDVVSKKLTKKSGPKHWFRFNPRMIRGR